MIDLQSYFKLNTSDKPVTSHKSYWHWAQVYAVCILQIILMVIVAKLAWSCNKHGSVIMRILITMLSTILSELYIIYFAIYRIFMGNKCF